MTFTLRPGRTLHGTARRGRRPGGARTLGGDLILGKDSVSAITTLVERHTRYVLLAALPHGRDAARGRDALVQAMGTLPTHPTRSLAWDQDSGMARHHEFTLATDIPVYFCDPANTAYEIGQHEVRKRPTRRSGSCWLVS